MKFILFTLLVSTAFAAPVDNFNDAIDYINQLASKTNDYLLISESPDQESLDLAAEFKDSIPKLQKIQRGLRRDGFEAIAKVMDITINFAKKCADDPQFIQDNKPQVIRVIVSIRNLFKVSKRYLDDEDLFVSTTYRESSLKSLNEAIETSNQLASETNDYLLISESPDQESLDLAAEFKDSIPKLQKIQRGLRRDGFEAIAKVMDITINFAKKCADDPQFIQDNKPQVIRVIVSIRNLFKVSKRYLDDEDLFVSTTYRQI